MKTKPIEVDLIDQAKEFYCRSCVKRAIKPIVFFRQLCEIDSKFVYLRNTQGNEVKVNHTKSHLYFEINGSKFEKRINYPEMLPKTMYNLTLESDLHGRFTAYTKKMNLRASVIIKNLIIKYLDENE